MFSKLLRVEPNNFELQCPCFHHSREKFLSYGMWLGGAVDRARGHHFPSHAKQLHLVEMAGEKTQNTTRDEWQMTVIK